MSAVVDYTFRSGSLSVTLRHPQGEQPIPDRSTITGGPSTVTELCRQALRQSLDFPPLEDCIFPGDRIAIVPDLETADLPQLLEAVFEVLGNVPAEGVSAVIILPADPSGSAWEQLRQTWPAAVRQLPVVIHDPLERSQVSYIASTAAGERIYINREAAEADVLITLGHMRYDSVYGIRGGMSAIFPGLADTETAQRTGFEGLERQRLDRCESRRQLVDEIGDVLGTHYTVQQIPGPLAPRQVLAGIPKAVQLAGTKLLEETWTVKPRRQAELAVLSIQAAPPFAWAALAETLEKILSWVEDGGRIAVIADLPAPAGPAVDLVRTARDGQDAAEILRRQQIPGGADMLRLLEASSHARVFVLSNLDGEILDELGLFPLADSAELQRLIEQTPRCLLLPNASALQGTR
jgi:hypothetical protein